MRVMKDSGIEWIGEIPKSWSIVRIKNVLDKTEFGIKIGPFGSTLANRMLEAGEFNVYSQANLISGDFSDTNHHVDKETFEELKTYEVKPDDVCVSMMGTIGKCKTVPQGIVNGIMDSHLIKIRLDTEKILSHYFEYVYDKDNGGVCYIQVQQEKKGTIMDGLNTTIVKNLVIPLPPTNEQISISTFLDKKCVEIDTQISRKEKINALLNERRQSIIYEAVTKGLNPNAPMKESGVLWIGRIPSNWYVGKTLYALSMPITDGPHETPELFSDGIPFVSAEAVSAGNGRIDFDHVRGYISEEYYKECCKKYIPQLHDIYMIKSGATTGKVALVDTDDIFTIWSPLAAFRTNESKCHYRFLYYFLQSDCYQKQVENMWSFGTQQNIGMRTLEKLSICFPPIEEQKQISDYLDNECQSIENLIYSNNQMINKLIEYRQSLIYGAVTGKIEV